MADNQICQSTSTFQTRIASYAGASRGNGDRVLSAIAGLFGRLERGLFADFAAGQSLPSLKSSYISSHRIPGRFFNSLRVSLEGKVNAVKASMDRNEKRLMAGIARAEAVLADLESKKASPFVVHHKRRRLFALRRKLAQLEEDIRADKVRLCFGSKRLWRRQHGLQANGYASHDQWLAG